MLNKVTKKALMYWNLKKQNFIWQYLFKNTTVQSNLYAEGMI